MQESAIRKMGTLGTRIPDLISFAAGFPAPDMFAWEEFREISSEVLASREAATLQYGPTRGYKPLLETLCALLALRGIRTSVDELVITTGSQQALDLVARILFDPGDVVLMELPTYSGAISAFRNVQARLVGVRQELDGIDVAHLNEVIARERATGRRVVSLYITPNFQNPSGLLLSLEKRRALLEWAASHDVLIIEDDPYGSLYFDDAANEADTRPMRADDSYGRLIYLSSFSKTLAPGFRVAWIAAPPPVASKIEIVKQATDLCSGALDQRIVHEAVKHKTLDRALPMLRAHYRHKRDVMAEALNDELGTTLRWTNPRGGFFLWVTLSAGLDADTLLTRALAERVSYVAGSAFYVEEPVVNALRLSFSAPTPERIVEGVRRFARAVHAELAAAPVPTRSS